MENDPYTVMNKWRKVEAYRLADAASEETKGSQEIGALARREGVNPENTSPPINGPAPGAPIPFGSWFVCVIAVKP